jgi:hypothetical protein
MPRYKTKCIGVIRSSSPTFSSKSCYSNATRASSRVSKPSGPGSGNDHEGSTASPSDSQNCVRVRPATTSLRYRTRMASGRAVGVPSNLADPRSLGRREQQVSGNSPSGSRSRQSRGPPSRYASMRAPSISSPERPSCTRPRRPARLRRLVITARSCCSFNFLALQGR